MPAGPLPTACPVCGDTVFLSDQGSGGDAAPAAGAAVVAVPAQPAGNNDLTLPPDPPVRHTTPLPRPRAETPSFSSLVGMPQLVPGVTDFDPGSVVPLDDQTIDFAPPPVPGYEIIGEVGRGGMGVVYKAKHVSLNRPVALKMILSGSHAGQVERERFRREAEAVATLQSPHIVQIFEIGEANGQLYLALEFVDGGSLAQHLKGNPWSAREAAGLVELLAGAVHYAHSQGVVHRDLKPGNILLTGGRGRGLGDRKAEHDGTPTSLPPAPKITDFGLAKRLGDTANPDGTRTGAVMGTPSYIAPEQASGKTRDVGPAADVYALGAILYEMLTGRPPFLGETPLDTVLQVMHDDPVPPKRLQPTVPRDLETICLKCLTKSPAKRYATAAALGDDLRRFQAGEPIKARPLSAWGRGVKWARRHPALTVLGAATAAATVALVAVLSVAYAQVKEAVAQKETEAEAAKTARSEEARERERAQQLARDIEKKRRDADEQNAKLKVEGERSRRAAFALQLAQIAAMCERDPRRARELLENETRCPPGLRDFTWAYLHRLCQREERVYPDHQPNDPLYAVAVSPTGVFVATAGNAGQVRVWDPRTGRTWAVLAGHAGRVTGVAFSPDSGALATCGVDNSVRLWELPVKMIQDVRDSLSLFPSPPPTFGAVKLDEPLRLAPAVVLEEAHAGEVHCVAFSPDGRFLVSGGEDGMLRWWALGGWRATNPVAGAAGGPAAAALLVDRAAASAQPVWLEREFEAHTRVKDSRGVRSVAFAESGGVLVSGGADRAARLWAADGTRLIRTFPNHAEAVRAVAVTPDGKTVATVNNGPVRTVRLINAETGAETRRLIGHATEIYSLAASADGEVLASTGFDKSIRLWNLEDGSEIGVLHGHEYAVSAVAFAPDRRTVVSVGTDATARVWHTSYRPSDRVETFRDPKRGNPAVLTASALSGGGAAVVGGDEQGRVQVGRFDLLQGRGGTAAELFSFRSLLDVAVPARKIKAVASSADGQTAAASTDKGEVLVWRIPRPPGGRPGGFGPTNTPHVPLGVPLPVYAMAIDPKGGRWLATLDATGVRVWDLQALPAVHMGPRPESPATPEGPGLIHRVGYPTDLAFHPAGGRLAVAAGNGVLVVEVPSGKVLASVAGGHAAKVEVVAFGGPDGELLATADANGVIKVWQVGPDSLTQQAELVGHTATVRSLAFSPDGRTLASGGDDRKVLLWDPVTGQERAVLTGHADHVLRVQFVPNGSALLTVGRDGVVNRWRSAGGALPAPLLPTPNPPRPPFFPGRG